MIEPRSGVDDSLLEGQGIRKGYAGHVGGSVLLDGVDLTLATGEQVAILGPSGSGKTTLLNLLAGLEAVDQGELWIARQPLHRLDEPARTALRRRQLGMVFQFFNLVPTLTVYENLLLPLQLCGRLDLQVDVDVFLDQLALKSLAHAYPEQLSGGEQQRIAIVRAMIHRPALVLADEPTGSLDNRTADQVMNWMMEALRQRNQSLVLVTHNEPLAQRADRILYLHCGRLQSEAPV